jgi:hypothetical protein
MGFEIDGIPATTTTGGQVVSGTGRRTPIVSRQCRGNFFPASKFA